MIHHWDCAHPALKRPSRQIALFGQALLNFVNPHNGPLMRRFWNTHKIGVTWSRSFSHDCESPNQLPLPRKHIRVRADPSQKALRRASSQKARVPAGCPNFGKMESDPFYAYVIKQESAPRRIVGFTHKCGYPTQEGACGGDHPASQHEKTPH